jgi:Mg-chelatase subunit ChlD
MINELNQVDLAFVVDTTGSMGAFINTAKAQMITMLRALAEGSGLRLDLRLGVVEYRDHPPQDHSFVARAHDLTGNLEQAQKAINSLQPGGGGDAPEAVFDGLAAAGQQLSWRPHSQRLAVLLGDAPPHGTGCGGDGFRNGCPCGLTTEKATALLEDGRITLYAVGLTPSVQQSFTPLARLTGGEYFASNQGEQAIATLKALLTREFAALDFDRRVLDACTRNSAWSIDDLGSTLASGRSAVSASLSRLGRRGFLE